MKYIAYIAVRAVAAAATAVELFALAFVLGVLGLESGWVFGTIMIVGFLVFWTINIGVGDNALDRFFPVREEGPRARHLEAYDEA